jgi:hypothetical protein
VATWAAIVAGAALLGASLAVLLLFVTGLVIVFTQ